MAQGSTRHSPSQRGWSWIQAWAAGLALGSLGGCYTGLSPSGVGGATDGDSAAEASAGPGDTDPDADTDTGGSDADPLGCGDAASVSPLRRLSQVQYRNTLRDLFAPVGIDVEEVAASDLARIPADQASSTFEIMDTRVSEQHARAYYLIADQLADTVAYDDAHLVALAGECALEANPDDACVDALIGDFGKRVFRRPLATAERDRYRSATQTADNGTELFRSLIVSLLLAPQFLYHVEIDGEGDNERFDLEGYGLASRLSYHFWQTMPDDALFAAAEDGSLDTNEGYLAQLERVFNDPRTQQRVDRFYDEWLQLGWLAQFPATAAFETFAEGTTIGEADADHLAAAQREIHALTRHFTWTQEGSLEDVYLSDLSFTQSPHLAALYGVEVWDGQSAPPRMPANERAGLLTRTAFLLTGDHETHPIHRGASVRRRLLCDELPSPDPQSLPPGALDPPPVTEDQTTRQRYEEKTADPVCATCHQLINPIGFVLEQYDSLGRFRTEERVIDDLTGDVVATLPIDSSAAPMITGDNASISTGLELSEQVVSSGGAEACFASQYFRATFGRVESDNDDCAIEAVEAALVDDQSLREALRTIALAPVFRARRVE